MQTNSTWQLVLDELNQNQIEITTDDLKRVKEANRIFVAGSGRSLLAIKSFAMRLSQLGKPTYVVGETNTPAYTENDLLIVATGSGSTPQLINMMTKAHEIKGSIWLLTATDQSQAQQLASKMTLLAGKGKYDSKKQTSQPMGALFEQSVMLYGDAFVLAYMNAYNIDEEILKNNHANLE